MLVGGDAETPGGVMLAAIAALRAGAGRAHVITDPTATTAMAIAQPELRVSALPEVQDLHGAPDLVASIEHADVVVVGSGCIDHERAGSIVAQVAPLVARDAVLLLDAAALAILGERPELVAELGERAILLPNPTEAGACCRCPTPRPTAISSRAARAAVARFRSTGRGPRCDHVDRRPHARAVRRRERPSRARHGGFRRRARGHRRRHSRRGAPRRSAATLWGVRAHGRVWRGLGGRTRRTRAVGPRPPRPGRAGIERVGGERRGQSSARTRHRVAPSGAWVASDTCRT